MRGQLILALLLAVGWAAGTGPMKPGDRKDCRAHYLAGASRSGVFPLSSGRQTFKVGCEFPKAHYPPLPVGTVVKNSLQAPFALASKNKTVSYQITDRDFLSSIISSAVSCEQQLEVVLSPPSVNVTAKIFRFTAETITGKQHVFPLNTSLGLTRSFKLGPLKMAGVLHLLPDPANNFTAHVSLSPLRCLHHASEKACELSRGQEVTVEVAQSSSLSFSFRTDSPSGVLFQVIQQNDWMGEVLLEDGYLLRFGDLRQSFKLLADGNWHEIFLDLHHKVLYVDGETGRPMALADHVLNPIKSIYLTVPGVVSKIQLDGGSWECQKSSRLAVGGNAKPEVLRQICQKDQPSFCHCKAPYSALFRNSSVPRCSAPNAAKAWTFDRNPRKLTFFYAHSVVRSSVSVLFRSDAESGLVLFGQRNESGDSERFQVEFHGKAMSAGSCSTTEKSESVCSSCRIERSTGFGHNQWVRVSLFKHFQYVYLTVDDQICALSPSIDALDRTRMFAGPATSSFLFIGGSYYLKSNELEGLKSALNGELHSFYDHTSQKPRSLRGCVAEVHVDGQQWDLQKVFNEQKKLLKSPSKAADVFAMQVGCSECTMDCGEFSCRRVGERNVCDCGQQFGVPLSTSARCDNKAEPISLIAAEDASLEYRFKRPVGKRVVKWWIHVLLPNVNDALQPVVTVGDFIISVGDYGRTVLFSAPDYDISEGKQLFEAQFTVEADDARLHLISMEETSDSPDKKDFLVRVDNQTRRLKRLDFSNFDVVVQAIRQTKSTEAVGCVSGIYFAMDGEAEEPSSLAFVNVFHDLQPASTAAHNLTVMSVDPRVGCGILDPQLWKGGSSPLGFVRDYDPHGVGERHNGAALFWIALTFLIACLIGVVVYFAYRNRAHTYRPNEHGSPNEKPAVVFVPTYAPTAHHEALHPTDGVHDALAPKKVAVTVPKTSVQLIETPTHR